MNRLLAGCLFGLSAAAMPLHAQTGLRDPAATATAQPSAPTPRGTAGSVVLDFEGLGDNAPVGEFYNGGGGTDYGISFSTNSLAIIDSDAGGTGNFGGEPSASTILFFIDGASATMNVPDGFSTGFSFYYTAINNPGTVVVYEGLNGTGTVLATLNLPVTPTNGAPDPTGTFSPLLPIGVAFSGIARSVDFGGTINQVGFDNITLGAATPGGSGSPAVALPVGDSRTLGLLAALLALCAGLFLQRRRRT